MYQSITRAIYRSVTVTQSPVRILQNTVPLNVNPLLGIYLTSFPEAKTATPTTHPRIFRSRENISYTYLKNKQGKRWLCHTVA